MLTKNSFYSYKLKMVHQILNNVCNSLKIWPIKLTNRRRTIEILNIRATQILNVKKYIQFQSKVIIWVGILKNHILPYIYSRVRKNWIAPPLFKQCKKILLSFFRSFHSCAYISRFALLYWVTSSCFRTLSSRIPRELRGWNLWQYYDYITHNS